MRGTLTLLVLAAIAGGCSTPSAQPPQEAPPATAAAAAPVAVPAPAPPAPLPETGAMPGRAMPEFRTLVSRKSADVWSTGPIDSRKAKGTTLWIMNSTTCGYCAGYADRMKAIESAYMAKGVDVVHVYPVTAESDIEKVEYHAKRGFRGGQVLEGATSIARNLAVDKTPTVFVTDARGVILYRGAIDSSSEDAAGAQPYLAQALDAVLAGKPVPLAETEPEG
jgi:hypothetical protein